MKFYGTFKALNLTPEELAKREVVHIDIASDKEWLQPQDVTWVTVDTETVGVAN